MGTGSLLGHLVSRFAHHPENLATEALGYILSHSPATRHGFLSFIQALGITFSGTLAFHTQEAGADGSIPDLVGTDADGRQIVLLEAKFDAGLTDNQPVAYLKRLPSDRHGILLFVGPAWRIGLLWAELVTRCRAASLELGNERSVSPELIVRPVSSSHLLALSSWRTLLSHLQMVLNAEGDVAALSDIAQLQGLCNYMDDEAFLPVRSEELTATVPSRLIQLNRVLDEVVDRAVNENLAVIAGRTSGGAGQYFRPLLLSGCGCYLEVNSEHWAKRRSTPIWLSVQEVRQDRWALTQSVKDALAPLELEDPPRVMYSPDAALVPLRIPLGAERPAVVDEVFNQLREVAGLLVRFSATGRTKTIASSGPSLA